MANQIHFTNESLLAFLRAHKAEAWAEGYIVGLDKARSFVDDELGERRISQEIRERTMPNPYRSESDSADQAAGEVPAGSTGEENPV